VGGVTALIVLLLSMVAVILALLAVSAARHGEPGSRGRSGIAFAAAVGVSILPIVALVIGSHWLVLAQDLRPLGPSCGYEDDPGSGWSGSGQEEIEWGAFPKRVCVSPSGAVYRGAAVQVAYSSALIQWITFLSVPVALILCPTVGLLAGSVVDRRRPRPSREAVGAPPP
jgi:hypothetical protein